MVFLQTWWINLSALLYYQTGRARKGLGVLLSCDIIKAHGGEIIKESKEGEGTAFIIQLPLPDTGKEA